MREIDLLLLNECCENKGSRENVIHMAFTRYYDASAEIIEMYALKRVKDKYILKHRDFNENSYSKKKIREEEIIFIRKIYIYLRIEKLTKENIMINEEANLITNKFYDDSKYREIDRQIYWKIYGKYID